MAKPTQDFRFVNSKPSITPTQFGYQHPKQNKGKALFIFLISAGLVATIFFISRINIERIIPDINPASKVKTAPPSAEDGPIFLPSPFSDTRQTLPLDTAYAYNNVKRVTYDGSISNMSAGERSYLSQLFAITDFLVIERVQNEMNISRHLPARIDNYDRAMVKLHYMPVPPKLSAAHDLIYRAIMEQHDYFNSLNKNKGKIDAAAGLVQSSSAKLIKAYTILLGAYANEPEHNKSAFRQHLCALDII